jgi:hypothetical protein
MNPQISRKPPIKRIAAVLISAFLLCACSIAAVCQEPAAVHLEDIWAQAKIAGQPAGFYYEKRENGKDGSILTSVELAIILNRMNSKVEIHSTVEYKESAEGRLLDIKSDSSSSEQSTLMEATVDGDSLLVRTTSGGKSYDRKLAHAGRLVGQEGMRLRSLSALKSPRDKVSFQTFIPELGAVVSVMRTMIGKELLVIEGKRWPSIKVEDVIENLPGKTVSWLDGAGRVLKQLQESPFGEIETIRTALNRAQLENSVVGELPPEAFGRTLARSNILLPHERSIERMKIQIIQRKPELGWPNFEEDNQRVLEKTPESVVLEMWRPVPEAKAIRPVKMTPELLPFIKPNPLLQSDDAAVQDIVRGMGELDSDVWRASMMLQKWTAENMQFDMGIAVASASEVARNRRGTCFGYSVLLGSLARAAGIPSRLRMGYVYTSGIWGGHAWVEVLVGNEWIPLDAAAYSEGPADAARFSAFTSSLENGISTQIGALMQLYGSLDIRVLEYTLKGKRVVVPANAKSYEINGNTYQNPWLGLTVTKPDSFRFSKLDAVWPDNTVVEMEGTENQIVGMQKIPGQPRFAHQPEAYLKQMGISGVRRKINISGFSAVEISSPERAGLAFIDEGQVWVLSARGAEAAHWLREVASHMKLRQQ